MKVKFLPQDVEYEIKPNQTVLRLAQDHGIHIKSVCKGIPSCAECRVKIAEGEYNVMPPAQAELNLIGTAHFVDHRRLACQMRCFGNITIDMSEQIEKENEVVKSKRPRGYVHKAEGEESQAVMGNIMQEESVADINERTANMSLQEEEIRRELARVRGKKSGASDSREARDRNDQNRNHRPKEKAQAASDSNKKPRRNRNRRRKKPGQGDSSKGRSGSGSGQNS